MGRYKRYRNKLEMFLSSNRGKRVLNKFYSWAAAFVILGALMKLLHIQFGDVVLAVSMLTEFAVFFVSGFETPQASYNWEEVFPELNSKNPIDKEEMKAKREYLIEKAKLAKENNEDLYNENRMTASLSSMSQEDAKQWTLAISQLSEACNQLNNIANLLNSANSTKVAVSSTNLASNSEYDEQMEVLNKNINGLNTIYELQLRSISGQIDTIEGINSGLKKIRSFYDSVSDSSEKFSKENEKMANQLAQLNAIYSRLIDALTVNMTSQNRPIQ